MFDEFQQLTDSPALQSLLGHYVRLSAEDRQAYHSRVMELEGCTHRDLTRLHGQLIAYGWVEQNTGFVQPGTQGTFVPLCYRATRGGIRTHQELGAATGAA